MANKKIDGIVEAIRVDADGQLVFARLYERHGVVFSDHMLVKRADLIERLKKGQNILGGNRTQYKGSEFETGKTLHLVTNQGKAVLVLGEGQPQQDQLSGLPRF